MIENNKINELKNHLLSYKDKLVGDFLNNNSSYDWAICKILFMEENMCRYWDAKWNWINIEFKKWKSIWLDLIRYSEVILWINELSKEKTFTIFFVPDREKTKIVEIIWTDTNKIIEKLSLDYTISESLIKLNKNMPRSLNAQASLTLKDIRKIADFII